MEGKKVYIIASVPTAGGNRISLEEEHRVSKYRCFLPAGEDRKNPILQFYAVHGGLRTVEVTDIVDIS